MNNLILVRHGQSQWNKEKRFTGWADVELTAKGINEAKNAGKLIKKLNIEFHAYFTSELKRAKSTLNIILKTLNKTNIDITKAWQLNERHYGNLTSFNKDEITKKHGKDQVRIWRRSFNVRPPLMNFDHPYKKKIYKNFSNIKMPDSESLRDTCKRVIPYYEKKIEPLLHAQKNVLIVFHGNSCRSLLKKIFKISKKKIIDFEIPTGNPLLIEFENLKVKKYKYLDQKRAKKILFNI